MGKGILKPNSHPCNNALLEEGAVSAAFDEAAAERAEEIAPLYRAWDKALAKDLRPHRTDPRLLEEGALRGEFDKAAQDPRHDGAEEGEGEDGRSPRKSWKQRAEEKGHRRGRGRGYGMKRDGGDRGGS